MKPTDKYIEALFTDYEAVDKLLTDLYPGDMDISVYPGVLKDNFIGYGPFDINGESYEYIVILEESVSDNTSIQRVYYTNDELFVDKVDTMLGDLDD